MSEIEFITQLKGAETIGEADRIIEEAYNDPGLSGESLWRGIQRAALLGAAERHYGTCLLIDRVWRARNEEDCGGRLEVVRRYIPAEMGGRFNEEERIERFIAKRKQEGHMERLRRMLHHRTEQNDFSVEQMRRDHPGPSLWDNYREGRLSLSGRLAVVLDFYGNRN